MIGPANGVLRWRLVKPPCRQGWRRRLRQRPSTADPRPGSPSASARMRLARTAPPSPSEAPWPSRSPCARRARQRATRPPRATRATPRAWHVPPGKLYSLLAVARLGANLEPGTPEHLDQVEPDDRLVLRNQNPHSEQCPIRAAKRVGARFACDLDHTVRFRHRTDTDARILFIHLRRHGLGSHRPAAGGGDSDPRLARSAIRRDSACAEAGRKAARSSGTGLHDGPTNRNHRANHRRHEYRGGGPNTDEASPGPTPDSLRARAAPRSPSVLGAGPNPGAVTFACDLDH